MTNFSIRAMLSVAALALTSLASVAHAQTSQISVMKVPFAFEVGAKHMEPGVYTVSQINSSILQVRSGSNAALAAIRLDSSVQPGSQGKAVFHKIGDQYFLSQVVSGEMGIGLSCNASSAEIKAGKMQAASNNVAASNVQLALSAAPR